ncbi:MAG: hypothetical protein GY852_01275, partial [bacterium]|nr:hypothetical protein [bacterium]
NIKVNVNAHVKKPSETVSGAIALFYGDYTNKSDAYIGNHAIVNVSGVTSVDSDAVIPNQIIVDDEWEEFLDTGKQLFSSEGWQVTPASPEAGAEQEDRNFLTGITGGVGDYMQGVNTMLADNTAAISALLNYFPSFLQTAGFIPAKIATTYVSTSAKAKTDDKYYSYQKKQFEEK